MTKVTGWFSDEIDVEWVRTTDQETDFEVKFAVDGDRRSFGLDITHLASVRWAGDAPEGLEDLNAAAKELADSAP